MRGHLKKLVRPVGLILGVVTLGFFISRIMAQPVEAFLVYGWPKLLMAGLAGLFFYLVCYLPLNVAWWKMLKLFGAHIPWIDNFAVSTIAQFAKYTPGNVAQYFGRHGMLRLHGAEHGALIGAAALEIIQSLVGGVLVAFLGLALIGGPGGAGPTLGNAFLWIGALTLGLTVFLAFLRSDLVAHWAFTQPLRAAKFELKSLAPILGLQVAGYLLIGIAFWSVCAILLYPAGPDFGTALAAVTLSWIVGFMTPGAPAGLGVREAILLATMGPAVGEAPAIAAITLYRAGNLLGDFIAFLTGLYLRKRRATA